MVLDKIRNFVKEHNLASFLLVTYAFTWTVQVTVALLNLEASWTQSILIGFGGFGPVAGAAFVVWMSGGSLSKWVSQAFKWRIGKRWWLAALGLPLVMVALSSALFFLFGGPLNFEALAPAWVYLFVLAWGTVWGGGQEELGWRGFMLPVLQEKYSALTSSILVGAAWTLWHLPLFLNSSTTHGGWPIGQQLLWVVTIMAGSVLWTWMYNNTGSVLLVAVFHAGINGMGVLHPADVEQLYPGGIPDYWLTLLAEGTSAIVLVGISLLVLSLYGWKKLSSGDIPRKKNAGINED